LCSVHIKRRSIARGMHCFKGSTLSAPSSEAVNGATVMGNQATKTQLFRFDLSLAISRAAHRRNIAILGFTV
jgi:hypothetical protein